MSVAQKDQPACRHAKTTAANLEAGLKNKKIRPYMYK